VAAVQGLLIAPEDERTTPSSKEQKYRLPVALSVIGAARAL
jgi:hypothetical protein